VSSTASPAPNTTATAGREEADPVESTTCNTAANYIDFMCKNGHRIGNYLPVPQGFTIAAAVLLVLGLFVHVSMKEHWIVTVLFLLFVVVVGALFGSLLTFYSFNINKKQATCVFNDINRAT
jgi:hypothetical protein